VWTPLTPEPCGAQVSDIWFWVDTSIDLSIVFDIVLNMNRSAPGRAR
jgi:hypothetical protein